MKHHMSCRFLISVFMLCAFSVSFSATYYVSNSTGDDNRSAVEARNPATPWKTIDKANGATLVAGDSVLFKKGETFRGSLIPSSGSSLGNITYGAYGTGNKPKLLGSRQRNSTSDWIDEGNNIWRNSYKPVNMVGSELLPNPSFDTDLSTWGKYDNSGHSASSVFSRTTAAGEYATSPGGGKLECNNHGSHINDIQIYTSGWSISDLKWYKLSFKAKSSQQFAFASRCIRLMKKVSPWTTYYSSVSSSQALSITTEWKTYEVYYKANTTAADSRIGFFLGNIIPNGAIFYFDSLSLKECDTNPELLDVDVGNIIFNNEAFCGIKVWDETDLNEQGKFWYDEDNDLLKIYSVSNPASFYSNLELALNRTIIWLQNKSYITLENLSLRYGGAHGIGGGNTHHIWVKNLDISFIGGADQFGGTRTVRFGNGIEFWDAAHDNIVEKCSFDQIYDAATTVQGTGASEVYNIYFRNNIITNSEYSFEFWESHDSCNVHDIYFENNTCLNAGGGWGYSQRPNPNGTHLMFYPNKAKTNNVFIRNNIFSNSTEYGVYWWPTTDVKQVILNNNCWYESTGAIAKIGSTYYDYATQWAAYKTASGQDSNSIACDPLLNPQPPAATSLPAARIGFPISKNWSWSKSHARGGLSTGLSERVASQKELARHSLKGTGQK